LRENRAIGLDFIGASQKRFGPSLITDSTRSGSIIYAGLVSDGHRGWGW
jgi:hypothetical protein